MSLKRKDTESSRRWWAWIDAVAESTRQSAPLWQHWGGDRADFAGPYCSLPRQATSAPLPPRAEEGWWTNVPLENACRP